jgi:phytoene/squalene synthetase
MVVIINIQGSVVIPKDSMIKAGATAKSILSGPKTAEESTRIKESVYDVASQAHGHLRAAEDILDDIRAKGRSTFALYPAVRSKLYLEKLRKFDFDPFEPALMFDSSHLNYQIKLLFFKLFYRL